MLEMYVGGPFAVDPTDPRNQFHHRALKEARLADEYRQSIAVRADASPAAPAHLDLASRPAGMIGRLRFALSGGQDTIATQTCDCLGSAS